MIKWSIAAAVVVLVVLLPAGAVVPEVAPAVSPPASPQPTYPPQPTFVSHPLPTGSLPIVVTRTPTPPPTATSPSSPVQTPTPTPTATSPSSPIETPSATATSPGSPIQTPTATDTPAPPPPTNTPGPSGGIVIDHRHVDAGELSLAELDAARQVVAYFNHASIGANILDGMRDLQSLNAARYSINIQSSSGTEVGINDYQAGSNGRPITKIDGFAANVKDGHDTAFMKFGTGDVPCVNGDTSMETMWTRYRDMMVAQQAAHPDTELVWWTIPIIARDHGLVHCNEQITWFNRWVRRYVDENNLVLFDIAAIESHDPNGNPIITPQGYEAAWPGYTYDGEHLNETGRQRVANAVWYLLAEIARE